jgi:hypothetical protein
MQIISVSSFNPLTHLFRAQTHSHFPAIDHSILIHRKRSRSKDDNKLKIVGTLNSALVTVVLQSSHDIILHHVIQLSKEPAVEKKADCGEH